MAFDTNALTTLSPPPTSPAADDAVRLRFSIALLSIGGENKTKRGIHEGHSDLPDQLDSNHADLGSAASLGL